MRGKIIFPWAVAVLMVAIFFIFRPGVVLSDNELIHKVRKKETLTSIAAMYGDTVKAIAERNKLDSVHSVFPGQILKVSPSPRNVLVSWYGPRFHGRPMANGEVFDMEDPTVVAHKSLPLGSEIAVLNPETKALVFLVVQDRGPYIPPRELDLSRAAARRIGIEKEGVAPLIYWVVSTPFKP